MINQGFPLQSAPIVDANGCLTNGWLNFFAALYDRTGGPRGVDAQAVYITAQGAATQAQQASDDAVLFAADRSFVISAPADPFALLALTPDRVIHPDMTMDAYMVEGR